MAEPAPPAAPGRRHYLDWLRGLAVLIMIESHLLDSWTRSPDRDTEAYGVALLAGGIGAPLFLLLAGASVALSASSRARRFGSNGRGAAAVVNRGLQIFGLAFLFRLQSCVLSWAPWWTMLKVDILNVMGPSIMAAAAMWGLLRSATGRFAAFAAAAAGIALATPSVRASGVVQALPAPLEAYLRPVPELTNFALLPSAGFLFAGAAAGVLLERTRTAADERRLNTWFAVAGAALAAGAFGASFLPSPFPGSSFWTSSPSYFFLRTGLLVLLVPLGYAWHQRATAHRWSPLRQLGRTSLFIYWIHVEMIYGLMSRPIHKTLSLPQAWFAVLAFTLFMLVLSLAKERIATRPPPARNPL